MTLKGKVAIVTGATSGIGRAISFCLSEAGAILCVLGRNRYALEELEKKLNQSRSYLVDLEKDEDIYRFKENFLKEFHRVDFLIHCAGVIRLGSVKDMSVHDFDLQFKVNVRAPYLLTHLFLPLLEKNRGCVVFINSSSAFKSNKLVSQYSATKHALKAIADGLRKEVNPLGIKVVSIYPGQTATPMQKEIYKILKRDYKPEKLIQPLDVAHILLNIISLPQQVEVTDINIRPFLKP